MTTFEKLLREAEETPIGGWDFTRLGDRISKKSRPWDFKKIVEDHARQAEDLLDMGTGGGERLAELAYRPNRTVATEGWAPNVEIAGARLRPLGVTVVWVEGAPDNVEQGEAETDNRLPFPSASFELITNRHESFVATEVARILTLGGLFLTQQTGGGDDFHDALGLPHPELRGASWNLDLAKKQLTAASLKIVEGGEGFSETIFRDVAAVAWYLRMVPWAVEGFSIATHQNQLKQLHLRIEREGPLTVRQPTFWLKAAKPTS